MLTAVSSWEPAYTASPETVSPASSCYPSPTRSLYGRTRAELEAAEALLMLSGSAPNRQYYRSYEQPTLSYQYPGLSYSQAGISYQLVGPAQPGNHALQAFPGQPFERKMATPIYAEVEEPIAGPSEPRGSGASSPRFVPKAHSMSPAPEQARAPSALAERSRSPTPAPTKPLSETSSVGPQRTAKSKGKARASPIATTTEETKGRKRKAKAKPEPKEPVKFNPADPRPYYIDRAEWIGLNLETGEPMAGVPPMKSPATEYQAHILAWIFDNVTPQPDKFWKAVVATKLSINSAKVHHWFTNQRQRVSKERKATKSATTDDLDEVQVNNRKIKMRRHAVDGGEQWTDGRFVGIVDLLIAERQQVFEEEVAAHLVTTQGDVPEVDAASDGEGEHHEA